MDFNDTPEESAFRAEARAFLSANAEPKSKARPVLRLGDLGGDAVQRCKEWQAKKADAGFAAITWPKLSSTSLMTSPRGPSGVLPANRACGTRGTWMSCVAK